MAENVRALDESLRQIPSYQHKDRIRRDAIALIRSARDLRPEAATYVHNDGTESFLLRFLGTVPISYAGSTYHIPVTVWIDEQYPFRPPRVFVTPTADMIIETAHRHVTHDGAVYLPYLNKWDPRNSSLDILATILSSVFSEMPPVRARPKQQQQQQQPPPPPPPGGPAPAYRLNSGGAAGGAAAAGHAAREAPASATSGLHPPASAREALLRETTGKVQIALDQRLRDVLAGMDRAWDQQRELGQRARARAEQVAELASTEGALEAALARAREGIVMAESWLEHHEPARVDEVDPDRVVVAADEQSRQLVDLVARIAATDDAYFHLEHALANGHVTVDDMLRSGRRLARQQFMDKALVAKVTAARRASGLAPYASASYGQVPRPGTAPPPYGR